MQARRLLLLLICGSLLAPACGGKGLGSEPAGQTIRAATGYNLSRVPLEDRRAPKPWKGTDLDGAGVSSGSLRGGVTVVNFWASWCGPCRNEQAGLERMWEIFGSKGVRFLGINIRDSQVNARAHVEEFAVTYPSVFNKDSSIAAKFRVLFIPTTYVLDRRGRVAARITGVTREDALSLVLDEELAR